MGRYLDSLLCLYRFTFNVILVSTPTGSTAYALSAGGPVVQNGVNSILIVPIAPNSLSFRPICFPSSCKIRVKLS